VGARSIQRSSAPDQGESNAAHSANILRSSRSRIRSLRPLSAVITGAMVTYPHLILRCDPVPRRLYVSHVDSLHEITLTNVHLDRAGFRSNRFPLARADRAG
jgi:hypothetical protein